MPTTTYRTANGEIVPGVTTVIGSNLGWNKNQLTWWAWSEGKAGRNFRDTAEKAAEAGTIAPYMIECELKGRDPKVFDETPKEVG